MSREVEAWLSRSVAADGTWECEPASPVAGRRLWLCAALIRPGLTGLLLRDVTHRNREDKRRPETHPLRLGTEGAGVGSWEWDLKNNEIYWSPQIFRLLGIDPMCQSNHLYQAWLSVVHPDDRDRASAHSPPP
ncbi:MAG: PAS domain-containing protein [Alphaproteobacteria bacterium]|nr:PAS domain-containing protein [Alphaproteobacteria bacterium]